MAKYLINSARGGISSYEDKGELGSFKFASNLDIRKKTYSISAGQALVDEGLDTGSSPSASVSPSASTSPSASPSTTASPSASTSPSSSPSHSPSPSTGISDSPSRSPSLSASPSASVSPSTSVSLSPSPSAGLSTIFAGLIYTFVEASDGYTYGFDNTGRVYRRDSDGIWVQVYKDPDGAIKGASEWYTDENKTYLYFATDTYEKRKELPGLSNWNDVTTVGNLTSADWHTQREAGGALVITNGSKLAMVGYDGSFTDEALNLIPGNLSKTIVERSGRSIIGTVRASNTSQGVNGAIDSEVPLAQIGNDGNVFFANMTDTIPVIRFPGGGKVNPSGVANEVSPVNFFEWEQNALSWIDKQSVGNMALFGVFGADAGKNGVYTYGRRRKDHPFVLNLEYALEVTEIGAVINVNGTILISYKDGSSFGVKAVDPDNKAVGTFEGLDFKSPLKDPSKITVWKITELLFKPLPNGSSIEFWYRIDKTGEFVQAKVADGNTNFSTATDTKAVFRIGAKGEIFEPKLVLNPFGNYTPEILKVVTHFE